MDKKILLFVLSIFMMSSVFALQWTPQITSVAPPITNSSIDHNQISGLQGGNTSQYYHLNQTVYQRVMNYFMSWITGSDVPTYEQDLKAYNGTLAYNSSLSNYYLNSNPNNFTNKTNLSQFNNDLSSTGSTNITIGQSVLGSLYNSTVLFIDGMGHLAQSNFFKYANGQLNLTGIGGNSPLLLNGNLTGNNNVCLKDGSNCPIGANGTNGKGYFINSTISGNCFTFYGWNISSSGVYQFDNSWLICNGSNAYNITNNFTTINNFTNNITNNFTVYQNTSEIDPIYSSENSTIVRQGNFNCPTGYAFQNATINSSGIFVQCIAIGGSQTPWLSDIDANGYDLNKINYLRDNDLVESINVPQRYFYDGNGQIIGDYNGQGANKWRISSAYNLPNYTGEDGQVLVTRNGGLDVAWENISAGGGNTTANITNPVCFNDPDNTNNLTICYGYSNISNTTSANQYGVWINETRNVTTCTGGGGNLPSGVKAYYTLDSGFSDETGNGYSLTPVGSPTPSTGLIEGDYNFNDGNTQYAYYDNPDFMGGAWTLSGWIKTTSYGTLVWFSGSPNFWMMINSGGYPYFHVNNGQDYFGTTQINDGNWHMLSMSYGGSGNVGLYVDGSSVGTLSNPGTSFSNFAIATWKDNTGYSPLNGDIDEFGIWDRGLSSTEISDLYNSGAGLSYFGGGNQTCNSTVTPILQPLIYWDDNTSEIHLGGNGYKIIVDGDLVPSINNTYSLGNSSNTWKDAYLGQNSLYLGDSKIGTDSRGAFVFQEPNANWTWCDRYPDLPECYNVTTNPSLSVKQSLSMNLKTSSIEVQGFTGTKEIVTDCAIDFAGLKFGCTKEKWTFENGRLLNIE